MNVTTSSNSHHAVVTGYTVDSNGTTTAAIKSVVVPLAFASPPVGLHYYHVAFLSTAIALGVPGNLLVVVVYTAVRRKIACDWYVMYIGVLDLVVCLFRVPTYLAMETGYWQQHTSDGLCQLVYWVSQSVITASVILFGFIAVDRYIKICRTNVHLSLRFCLGSLAAISVISVLSAMPAYWMFSNNGQGDCMPSLTLVGTAITRAYYSFIFGVFILMFVVVVISYTLVIIRVWQSRKILKAHGERARVSTKGKSRVKRRGNRVGAASHSARKIEAGVSGESCDGEHSSHFSGGLRMKLWTTRAALSPASHRAEDAERPKSAGQAASAHRGLAVARGQPPGVEIEAKKNGNDFRRLNENMVSGTTARDAPCDQRGAPLSFQLAGNGDSLAETRPEPRDDNDFTTDTDAMRASTSCERRDGAGNRVEPGLKVPGQRAGRNSGAVPSFQVSSSSDSAVPSVSSASRDGGDSEAARGRKPRHSQNESKTTASSSTKGDLDSRNLRLTLLLLVMTVIFVVSWIPPYVAMVWYFYVGYTPPFSVADLFLMTCAPTGYVLNHFANPFVYLILNSSFRRHLVALWRKLKGAFR